MREFYRITIEYTNNAKETKRGFNLFSGRKGKIQEIRIIVVTTWFILS